MVLITAWKIYQIELLCQWTCKFYIFTDSVPLFIWHDRWKEKNRNFFPKYKLYNELFQVVTSIMRWEIDMLKLEKENGKVVLCSGIGQVIREICGISRKQIFNKKEPAPALNQEKISIYLYNFEQRSLSHLILHFFADRHHNSWH